MRLHETRCDNRCDGCTLALAARPGLFPSLSFVLIFFLIFPYMQAKYLFLVPFVSYQLGANHGMSRAFLGLGSIAECMYGVAQ